MDGQLNGKGIALAAGPINVLSNVHITIRYRFVALKIKQKSLSISSLVQTDAYLFSKLQNLLLLADLSMYYSPSFCACWFNGPNLLL